MPIETVELEPLNELKETLVNFAEQAKPKPKQAAKRPLKSFWFEKEVIDKHGQSQIIYEVDSDGTIEFLESYGFRIFKHDKRKAFIRDQDNVLTEVDESEIRIFLKSFVRNLNENDVEDFKKLKNHVINSRKLNAQLFETIKFFDAEFIRDNAKNGFLFYENGYTTTNAEKTSFAAYEAMSGKIWDYWKIPRRFVKTDERGDFERFIWQVATGELGESDAKKDKRCRVDFLEDTNVQNFETTLGYLIHTYKDPSKVKAVVAFDDHELEPDEADGRTGKSLLCKALGTYGGLRKVVTFNGKNVDFKYTHVFDKVKFGDQIVNFNDVTKHFDFEQLFHILTEGFSIVPKGSAAFDLSFQDSPKVYISTNYTIQGAGGSASARQHLLPFKPVYSSNYDPEKFFGRKLFDDWDAAEWNRFDNYLHYCLRRYLLLGLVSADEANYKERRAQQGSHPAVIDFIRTLVNGKAYEKSYLFREFQSWTQNAFEKWTPNKFTMYFKASCSYLKVEINAHKNGGRDRDPKTMIDYLTLTNIPK